MALPRAAPLSGRGAGADSVSGSPTSAKKRGTGGSMAPVQSVDHRPVSILPDARQLPAHLPVGQSQSPDRFSLG